MDLFINRRALFLSARFQGRKKINPSRLAIEINILWRQDQNSFFSHILQNVRIPNPLLISFLREKKSRPASLEKRFFLRLSSSERASVGGDRIVIESSQGRRRRLLLQKESIVCAFFRRRGVKRIDDEGVGVLCDSLSITGSVSKWRMNVW